MGCHGVKQQYNGQMNKSLQQKLQSLLEAHEEREILLSSSDVTKDQKKYQQLLKEHAEQQELVDVFKAHEACTKNISDLQELMGDPDMKAMAEEELRVAKEEEVTLDHRLECLLLPKDDDDRRNVFVEIRAGTGGDEAAIFAGDLARMYMRYAERKRWQVEVISQNEGEHGGYKEIIFRLAGDQVYSQLKFESGAHRVQRVPKTEAQGRIHTSACTVAVLPEIDEVDININPADLKIDTFRASGAGGQHVNKTDSAIRITHIPTGTVVECQDERSQHKNKARALSVLQARISAVAKEKQQGEQATLRRNLVGSGDRSERIRTYNFPQGRLTDHRIDLTLYKLDAIVEGDLDDVLQALIREHQADLLASMGG